MAKARQITFEPHGHIITNVNVWSPDSRRIVYDIRSDVAGNLFDGDRIETVDIQTGDIQILYSTQNEACCGVATFHPHEQLVIFILGPENPTPEFTYGAARRQGVMVFEECPELTTFLEARDLTPPFTPGALRGGSHVHVFSPDGKKVSFTYEDHVLERLEHRLPKAHLNQRNIGVSILGQPVEVKMTHERNHDGTAFSVLVSKTVNHPTPGTDEISRAYEECWLSSERIAFLGDTIDEQGRVVPEVFVLDLNVDLTVAGAEPLEGTTTTRPAPPHGICQRRLTWTPANCVCRSPRFWVRGNPAGSAVAFLRLGDDGLPHLWLVSVDGGEPRQIDHTTGIQSAFTWSPDGCWIACKADNAITVISTKDGHHRTLVQSTDIRPEAVVFSPNGEHIAFVQTVDGYNQIFVVDLES